MEDAETTKAKLAEAEEAYKNALTEARVEAAQIRENARAEAQRTIEELRAAGAGGVGPHHRPRRGAAGPPAHARSCANCAPRSARWRSSCPRRSSTSGWPTTPRCARPSTAFIAGLEARDDAAAARQVASRDAGCQPGGAGERPRPRSSPSWAGSRRPTAWPAWPTSCTRSPACSTRQPRLRRRLADPASSAEARKGLVERLARRARSARARCSVAGDAVSQRWSIAVGPGRRARGQRRRRAVRGGREGRASSTRSRTSCSGSSASSTPSRRLATLLDEVTATPERRVAAARRRCSAARCTR